MSNKKFKKDILVSEKELLNLMNNSFEEGVVFGFNSYKEKIKAIVSRKLKFYKEWKIKQSGDEVLEDLIDNFKEVRFEF